MQVSSHFEKCQGLWSGQMLSITKRILMEKIKWMKYNVVVSMENVCFFHHRWQKHSYIYIYIAHWGWDLAQQSSQLLIAVSKLTDSQTLRLSWEAATNDKEALKHLNLSWAVPNCAKAPLLAALMEFKWTCFVVVVLKQKASIYPDRKKEELHTWTGTAP